MTDDDVISFLKAIAIEIFAPTGVSAAAILLADELPACSESNFLRYHLIHSYV